MRTYTVVIVDDTEEDLKESEMIIRRVMEDKGIPVQIKAYLNGGQLMADLDENRMYDIFLLDLELPGYTGFQLAEKIRFFDKTAFIIFYTAHDKLGHLSYAYHPYATLYKSLGCEGIKQVIGEVIDTILENDQNWYIINNERRLQKFSLKDVIYIERVSRNAVFYTIQDQEFKERISLKELYKRLPEEFFIFTNPGTIINMRYIQSLEKGIITLSKKVTVPISMTMISEVKRKVMDFYGR